MASYASPWLEALARTLGQIVEESMSMDEENAIRWLDERKFRYYQYVIPAQGGGIPVPEKVGWDVSGWCWPPGGGCEVRIHVVGATLVEAAVKGKLKWEAVMAPKEEKKKEG